MGYQESLLICESRDIFNQLCRSLNTAKPYLEDNVSVFAIGQLKKRIGLADFFTGKCNQYLPKGTYFIWWGGERHPYQSGWYQELYKIDAGWPRVNQWSCVFCDYIANMDAFLRNIDTSKSGILQENDRIRIFEIPENGIIRQEYTQKIENLASPSGYLGRKENA